MNEYADYWEEVARLVILGDQFGLEYLQALGDLIAIDRLNSSFLPKRNIVSGTPFERKESIFSTAKNLWSILPEDWLKLEQSWLAEARKTSGSQEAGGKDKLINVVSPEILLRILATIKLVRGKERFVRTEAVRALSAYLHSVLGKGRSCMVREGDRSAYAVMKEGGLVCGEAGGRYLPNPFVSFHYLLLKFNKEVIRPEAYIK